MGLRVVYQIATSDKRFLLENQIPERLIELMDSEEPKLCWLAVRTSCHFIQIFQEMKIIFAENRGKQKVFQILGRASASGPLLRALAGLITLCGEWTAEERADISGLICGFEGYESVKQLLEFVTTEAP
jgi:hypothetical protein